MKKVMLILMLMAMLTGCTEPQKQTKTWGKGELSPEWVEMFGDNNQARIDKALADAINKHETHLYGTNVVKDGKKVHNFGVIDLVVDLQNRVKALEAIDPNECPLKDNVEELNGVVRVLSQGPEVVE